MKKWLKTSLLVLFVYLPAVVMVMAGFSVFGLGITIFSGLILITNTEVRAWFHAKKGFRKRFSRLPLISLKPTRNNAILTTIYLFVLSFFSWLILGGTHTINLGVDLILSAAGIVLFYGFFVEGWLLGAQELYPQPAEDKLASLIPELSIENILAFVKSNALISAALVAALLSPLFCVGSGSLMLNDGDELAAEEVVNQELEEDAVAVVPVGAVEDQDPTQTPHIIVVSPTPPSPTATAPEPSPTAARKKQLAQVINIVDGDTIRVLIDGAEYPVRYIGIDTPEVQHNEWYGAEARDANAALVGGREVLLEKDVSETDQYDRLLRYVYLIDGTFVNAELVRLGFAESKAYPPDTKYYDDLEALEQEAKREGLGLWQAEPKDEPTKITTSSASVMIVAVDKRAEYVDIKNVEDQSISIEGWTLRSDKGDQDCGLGGTLAPGEVLRIWALAEDNDKEGFNCWFGSPIWNNSEPDPAVLFDASFTEVDRYP